MTNRPLVHIGYHKTATSWMQDRLFVAKHGYRQLCTHKEVFELIVKPHGLWFDPEPMKTLIERGMRRVGCGEVGVISSEILSGHPFYGGYGSDIYAERLKIIAPNARILISVRDQMRILPSVYMQYILRGGTMTPAQFFSGTETPGYAGFSPEHFKYDRLVAHYQALFGVNNVCIITQESLRHNMVSTMERLATFSDNTEFTGLASSEMTPVGISYPEYASPILRRINHIQRSQLNPRPIISLAETPKGIYKLAGYALKRPMAKYLLKNHTPVTDYVHGRFSGYYAESNQILLLLTSESLDLSSYDGVV